MSDTLGKINFADKRKVVTVSAPELGGTIRLRELRADQFVELSKVPDADNLAHSLAMSIVDDNGERVFTSSEEDIKNLKEMGYDLARRLNVEMNKLNGLGKEAAENTAKKSEASLDSASASS